MINKKKYQTGATGVSAAAKFGNFMNSYGSPIMGTIGTITPLLRKKPDFNAKPYKKGSKLIKYQGGNQEAKSDTFSDPEVNEIVKYIQSNNSKSPSQELPSIDTIVGRRGNRVTPTTEETNKKLLEEVGEIPSESQGYSGSQTATMGSIAALLKAMHRYKGRGKNLISPIGRFGSWAMPFGVAASNIATNTAEEAGEKITNWKNAAIQTGADLLATFAGRKLSRGTIRSIQEKLSQNRKLKEDVKQFKEKEKKYPENLIAWNKELEAAKKSDANMSIAERKQRLDDFNEGKVKYLHNEQEVLSRKPKKPSAKNIDLPEGIMQLYGKSLKQEAQKIGNQFGLKFLKDFSVKDEEALVRGTRQKAKTLSDLERRMRRDERNSNIGLGLITGTVAAGTGSLPFFYYADKKAELKKELEEKQKRKQKSNK